MQVHIAVMSREPDQRLRVRHSKTERQSSCRRINRPLWQQDKPEPGQQCYRHIDHLDLNLHPSNTISISYKRIPMEITPPCVGLDKPLLKSHGTDGRDTRKSFLEVLKDG